MIRKTKLAVVCLLGVIITARGQQVFKRAQANHEPCPDTVPTRGNYVNASYGFRIKIPNSLAGYWNSSGCVKRADAPGCVCMSDDGRIIAPGSKEPSPTRYIEAYAGFAADLDDPTVAPEAAKRLAAIREKSRPDTMEIRRHAKIVLSGTRAERLVVRYYGLKEQAWFIDEFVEAVKTGIEYSLYMRTGERFYERDLMVFESIVRSFVLTF